MKHTGGNPSCANSIILRNESCELKHGQVLEFLVGEYKFEVEFDPVPTYNCGTKRKNESVTEENSSELKRFCKDQNSSVPPAACAKNMWEKIDDGKLYVFTSAGVTSSSKVCHWSGIDGS